MNWTLITGAAKNLGASTALALAEKGCNVLIHYHTSETAAKALVEKCKTYGVLAECIQGDFSSLPAIKSFTKSLVESYPTIKNLINNVGNYLDKPALTTSIDEWDEIFQTNLYAPVALVQALLPSIIKQKGNIINIGSVGISVKASGNTAYRCAKTSLLIFTKSLAKELASKSVRVNMVSPGQLKTSLVEINNIPIGYAAEAKEVTNAILFLLSNESGYITGQNIEIAGGLDL